MSALIGYSFLTIYISVILSVWAILRAILIPRTYSAFIGEINRPDPLLKLCECVHLMRIEYSLEKEEEYHLMLVEILRSPELLKAITGTSLKGDIAK